MKISITFVLSSLLFVAAALPQPSPTSGLAIPLSRKSDSGTLSLKDELERIATYASPLYYYFSLI